MGTAWTGWFFLNALKGVQRWQHSSVSLRRPGFEQPKSLTQVLKDGLVTDIGDLAIEEFHSIDKRAEYFLAVCAGIMADIARVERAFALYELQHLRALPLIGLDIQHVQRVDVAWV
jgi:hypothetical protein